MADGNDNRGFASMDEDEQREIASKGGSSQGEENNPGNFANRSDEEMSDIGREGAEAQSTEAKQRGGENSRRDDD